MNIVSLGQEVGEQLLKIRANDLGKLLETDEEKFDAIFQG